MTSFQSINYEKVLSAEDEYEDDSSELPPTVVTTRETGKNGRWNHIENLDDFFSRVYKYHQMEGFTCLLLTDIFELLQYVFIVLFATFLAVCVDRKLFDDPNPVFSEVIHLERFETMPSSLATCLVVAFLFWLIRLVKVMRNGVKAWEIRHFYYQVLQITDNELQNMQWRDVQKKLVEVQRVHQMCIHKDELSELDIHHRILRQKNYMIALQNKKVIPCTYNFPVLGERTFLTEGLKYNLNLVLFKGPGAPFEKSWKLRSEYKDYSCRTVLAATLSRRIFLLGIANLILCPFILIYQILYSFFTYAELIKRSPDRFGARRWSPYGRLYLRHFNEMDHEFQNRLSKAYEPAKKYMNAFVSPILAILARNVAFFTGAILAVMLGLSFYDQDILTAEHVISFMATLGIIIKICTGFIPDEHMVFCPESLMKIILSHTHYIPDEWKGRTHTLEVRAEFSRLFQYKFVYLIEELLSPLLTPLILCFSLRYKAQQIIDFYRNFSVEVTGVGDVCSFAQMDIRKHGNNQWNNTSKEDQMLSAEQQAENGKTELSLLHFSMKNPSWKPTDSGKQFIQTIKEQAIQESLSMSHSMQRQTSIPGLYSLNYMGSNNDFTAFIGLQSLSQPVTETEMISQQEEAIVSASMMHMHEVHDRRLSLSSPDIYSHYPANEGESSLQQTWPQFGESRFHPYTSGQEQGQDPSWKDNTQV